MKKNAKKVVTFGEIMMRLNPPGNQRFRQCEGFEASYAGGEANVAVSLANYGMRASFVTKVPSHEIGQCALDALTEQTSTVFQASAVLTGAVKGRQQLGI